MHHAVISLFEFGQLFFQRQKIRRAVIQIKAVELIIRVFFSPELPCLISQGYDLQIAQVILQVVAGFLGDIGVDGCGG